MKAFITVIGHDTVGVVAKVAALCSELNINIEDVTQSILQGMFAMIMLVDISHCSVSHEELHKRTEALAKEMGMQINVTRQEVFDAMPPSLLRGGLGKPVLNVLTACGSKAAGLRVFVSDRGI